MPRYEYEYETIRQFGNYESYRFTSIWPRNEYNFLYINFNYKIYR